MVEGCTNLCSITDTRAGIRPTRFGSFLESSGRSIEKMWTTPTAISIMSLASLGDWPCLAPLLRRRSRNLGDTLRHSVVMASSSSRSCGELSRTDFRSARPTNLEVSFLVLRRSWTLCIVTAVSGALLALSLPLASRTGSAWDDASAAMAMDEMRPCSRPSTFNAVNSLSTARVWRAQVSHGVTQCLQLKR